MEIDIMKPTMIQVRDSYNGTFMTYSMTRKSTKTQKKLRLLENQKDVIEMKRGLNLLPSPLYNKAIQISKAKFNDLQDLKKFLPRKAQLFYEGLTFKNGNNTDDDGDVTVGEIMERVDDCRILGWLEDVRGSSDNEPELVPELFSDTDAEPERHEEDTHSEQSDGTVELPQQLVPERAY
ncbi:hypothetical protein J6590_038237 [Homalodisca vitripennis]|nr:hypothetical protein J6590_038237 [Homalodisca vitripennis]